MKYKLRNGIQTRHVMLYTELNSYFYHPIPFQFIYLEMLTSKRVKKQMRGHLHTAMEEWCEMYGVPKGTLEILERSGFNTLGRIVNLTQEQLGSLALTPNQRALIRGALLQHRANTTVDKMARTEGRVTLE